MKRGLVGGILVIWVGLMLAVANRSGAEGDGARWNVSVDTSSLEAILLHPETIIEDPDAFWANDAAYVLSKRWHDNNHIPLDTKNYYENWLSALREFADIPEDQRRSHEAFLLLEAVRAREPIFADRGVALLDDFLPKNGLKFTTTIHVTTKTLAFGFMTNGQIVSDILSSYYQQDPDLIWNLLTHECFHIGYGYNRHIRREIELDDGFVYNTLLDGRQNEGLATYLGYAAQAFFPGKDMPDYQMLDDPAEVRRQVDAVNVLFSMVGQTSPDSPPPALQRLKTAAVEGDRAAFDNAAAEMLAGRGDLHPQTRNRLERFGYGMLNQEAYEWAIAVFEVDVELFPEEPNSYDCLAEAYLKSGDRENAIRFYKEALKVDPHFENAAKMLVEIE